MPLFIERAVSVHNLFADRHSLALALAEDGGTYSVQYSECGLGSVIGLDPVAVAVTEALFSELNLELELGL